MKIKSFVFKKLGIIGLLVLIAGCGFHLRGSYSFHPDFLFLRIVPSDPYSPFQRTLRLAFKCTGIQLVEDPDCTTKRFSTLQLSNIINTERTLAYGGDVQINRSILLFGVTYSVIDPQGKVIVPPTTIQRERELLVNPNALLSTESDRARLREDLYQDAANQLLRQLSVFRHAPSNP